ncbi:MAG: sulfur carrier protein ThiS [Streptosporangiaceae bacterium]|jgi:sulfur carrier protein|nr:thiamine biosynthesis protein ThiS [Actinomycetota bacterium]
MEVIINGERRRVASPMSLGDAVSMLTTAASGVAVALNGEVVRRADWACTPLSPGDQVEVLTAVQGG